MHKLSLIIPVYNEEESLSELYKICRKNLLAGIKEKLWDDYEVCFVDDGSTDRSARVIQRLVDKDGKLRLIVLRKNFGKSKALQAAFSHVNGDIIVTMDADLQDDPKEILNFVRKIDEGYDLVSGWKYLRHDPLEKTLPSKLFNWVTAKISGVALHDFNCGFKAYRRDVIKAIRVYGEFHRYIPVLANRYGFKIAEIRVAHHQRRYGKSKFGIERYFRGFLDAVSVAFLTKCYDKPMYFFGMTGLFLSAMGFLICCYLSCLWFMGEHIGQRPLLMLGVLFILVGVLLFCFGLLANLMVDNIERRADNDAYIKEIIGEKQT